MFKRLLIIGAGGHGKVIADIAMKIGYTDICFADDKAVGQCMGYPIISTCEMLSGHDDGQTEFIIAIGSNAVRKRIAESHDLPWATLIHPSAQIGADVHIAAGTVIMANAAVNPCAVIGRHCIVNTGAIVEHDNVLEDYVHISPGATLGGTVHIGEETHVGIGAAVKNNIQVSGHSIVGAGAVVVKHITQPGTYIGVPAMRKMGG